MAKSKSAKSPAKPHVDFPLWVHAAHLPEKARWAKKVRGKLCYFGYVKDDPSGEKALELWLEQKDELLAGRTPRARSGEVTVAGVVNAFLTFKERLVDSGELAPRTFARYEAAGKHLASSLGRNRCVEDLRPADFEALRAKMAKRWQPIALANEIQMVRSIFKYAYDAALIEKPIRFGPGFDKPSAKVLRQTRAANGPKMFEASQVRTLLEKASPRMKAMILLAINGAIEPGVLATLTIAECNSTTQFLYSLRSKTAIPRRIPLWPETREALAKAIETRPQPKNEADAGLLFIGARGTNYKRSYRVAAEFKHLLDDCKIVGRDFYDLRRTFQTIGEGANDLVAVSSIMGHAPHTGDMASIYRQRIDDNRLLAVTDHVRKWLYPATAKAA